MFNGFVFAYILGAAYLLFLAVYFDAPGQMRREFAPMFDGVSDWALGLFLGLLIAFWAPLVLGGSLVAAVLFLAAGVDTPQTEWEDDAADAAPGREIRPQAARMGQGDEADADLRRIDRRGSRSSIIRQINEIRP